MSKLNIHKFKLKKLIAFSGLIVAPIFASLAIACTSSDVTLTEEDKRFAETGKGTDISVKVLKDRKSIVQLKYAGYEYFTFSDYWWSESRSKTIKVESYYSPGIDIEKGPSLEEKEAFWKNEETNPETDNHEVFFKIDSLDNLKKEIAKNTVLENSVKKDDQENSENQFKSVSLVTDETSLKTQLRVTDEENEKFSKFVKEKIDSNLKDEEIEKMKPWNSYFNYDLINKKLDLKNYDYLFIKDLTEFIYPQKSPSEADFIYHKVNKGIQIDDYRIDQETKTIVLKFSWFKVPEKERYVTTAVDPSTFETPKTITSFLLPVSKNWIEDFDFNEWKIVRDTWS
ncbi:hypothetical protein [Mycoplasmopsis agassizii]|uniref:Lipoprotein n=1 Tax=Mycoplasmopsis agassizii TaxID=33922 RepID=A0ABX4H6J7_9BACT|nr:hypothetical protein [Mycoplasmopsis agassizii]PAF55478.1 hypothetical protein CJF60_02220 [Mycoplasmopsis agassizii]SMC18943.1 hypothetical protein SAMN02745179_00811 [Mycoplasmopsis agassizii]